MPHEKRIVAPGPKPRTVKLPDGTLLNVPDGWSLLPPGDAGLTRRVKASGPTWTVKVKKGRRTISQGVWAATQRIEKAKTDLQQERSTDAYAKRQASAKRTRDRKQSAYVEEFESAVFQFLAFAECHCETAKQLAKVVTRHATPVGSGTVARTQRIPVERRAESAVIAWLRHQTTAYDEMKIPRVKGKRREVRRMLAERSRILLQKYRSGDEIDIRQCPLRIALNPAPSQIE